MKQAIAASTFLALAAAVPQGPPGGFHGGPGGFGPFAAFPSCVSDCWSDVQGSCSSSDYSCFCSGDVITNANSCIDSSDCSDTDKDNTYKAIAQLCANAGASVTASPEATWSATSGGANWPSGWTTNSAWPTSGAVWGPGGPGGWSGQGGWGPFGHGGPNNGWGPWASASSGAWTNGPWTSWWGTDACPGSTWSGWTEGSWATSAPWTSWAGCTATTTGSSVVTTTSTGNGTTVTKTTTEYGVNVAAVTNGGSGNSDSSSSTSDGAAPRQTGFALPAAAGGVLAVIGGALVL